MKQIGLLLLVLTGVLPGARGEEFRTDINPALLYYQAFLKAPDPMSDADRNYLSSKKGLEGKLPERFGQIVAGYDIEYGLLRQAAQAKVACDWGIDVSAGPNTMLPHLGRAKAAAETVQLRAAWALQHSRPEDARDDLLAAFVLGRNAGNGPFVISALIEFSIEKFSYGMVAQHFGEFPPEILTQLVAGFDAAPSRHTLAACMPDGNKNVDWILRKLLEQQKAYPNDDAKVLAAFHEILPGDTNVSAQVLAASGGASEGIVKLVREVGTTYTRLGELMALPEAEYEAQAKQFFAEAQKSPNPLVRETITGPRESRTREFKVQAELAMMHAALEYKLHGESGLKGVMDPFGKGPFAFERFVFKGVDRGFELKSAYTGADAPFVLIFVEKQGPAFQIAGPDAGKAVTQ